jgi:Ca2+/Na+ antiporter
MGFSASFGGPLFNLLLGVGLPFSIAMLKNGREPVQVFQCFGFLKNKFQPVYEISHPF